MYSDLYFLISERSCSSSLPMIFILTALDTLASINSALFFLNFLCYDSLTSEPKSLLVGLCIYLLKSVRYFILSRGVEGIIDSGKSEFLSLISVDMVPGVVVLMLVLTISAVE